METTCYGPVMHDTGSETVPLLDTVSNYNGCSSWFALTQPLNTSGVHMSSLCHLVG